MILAVAGFLFWPWLISNFPRLSWPTVRLALFLLPLLALSLRSTAPNSCPAFLPAWKALFYMSWSASAGFPMRSDCWCWRLPE
jgi:hypothetical protein